MSNTSHMHVSPCFWGRVTQKAVRTDGPECKLGQPLRPPISANTAFISSLAVLMWLVIPLMYCSQEKSENFFFLNILFSFYFFGHIFFFQNKITHLKIGILLLKKAGCLSSTAIPNNLTIKDFKKFVKSLKPSSQRWGHRYLCIKLYLEQYLLHNHKKKFHKVLKTVAILALKRRWEGRVGVWDEILEQMEK